MNRVRQLLLLITALAFLMLGADGVAKSPKPKSAQPQSSPSPSKSEDAKPKSDWQIVKIGTRDYLTVDNIAKFYGLTGALDPNGKNVTLSNSRYQIQLMADTREATVNGVRNWLCFPVIKRDEKFLVSRVDLAKTLEPQLRPHMIQRTGSLHTIVLDAGHGGFDKGAQSPYGNEKNFALDVVRRLRPLLQARGFKVIMTRENDVFLPLELRARIANATHDSVFVSVHFNSTSNTDASGFEIFSLTPRGAPSTADDALALSFLNMQEGSPVDAESFELSTAVYHSMIGHFPEFDRGIKRARFAVLRRTTVPAILVEGGFLSQAADSRLIASPTWRGKLAESIAAGIDNFRNATERKQRQLLAADYRAQGANSSAVTLLDLAEPPGQLEAPSSFGVIAVAPDADPNKEQ
jgi:N-acetylmuramoyl-L-alanine amidase